MRGGQERIDRLPFQIYSNPQYCASLLGCLPLCVYNQRWVSDLPHRYQDLKRLLLHAATSMFSRLECPEWPSSDETRPCRG